MDEVLNCSIIIDNIFGKYMVREILIGIAIFDNYHYKFIYFIHNYFILTFRRTQLQNNVP